MTALGLQALFSNATASAALSAGSSATQATQSTQADQPETPFAALWQLLAETLATGSGETTAPVANAAEEASLEGNAELTDEPAPGQSRAKAGSRARKSLDRSDEAEDPASPGSPGGQAAAPAAVTLPSEQPLTGWTGCWWAGLQPAAPTPEIAEDTSSGGAAPSFSGTQASVPSLMRAQPMQARAEAVPVESPADAADSDPSRAAEDSAVPASFDFFVQAFDCGSEQPSPVLSGQARTFAGRVSGTGSGVSNPIPAGPATDSEAPEDSVPAAAVAEATGSESGATTEPVFQMRLSAGDAAAVEDPAPSEPRAKAAVARVAETEMPVRSGETAAQPAGEAADTDVPVRRAEAGTAPAPPEFGRETVKEPAAGAATAESAPANGPAEPASRMQNAAGGDAGGESQEPQPEVRTTAPRVRSNDAARGTADSDTAAEPDVERGPRASTGDAPQGSALSALSRASGSPSSSEASPAPARAGAARIEPEQPAEAARAPSSARDISLRLDRGEQRVEVRLVDRGGDVQVAVRASDSRLADDLRRDLSSLTTRLEDAGFRAEAWQGGVHAAGRREIHEPATSADAQTGNMQSDPDGRERQNQSREDRGQESPDRNKTDGKQFGGFLTSFTRSLS